MLDVDVLILVLRNFSRGADSVQGFVSQRRDLWNMRTICFPNNLRLLLD